MQKGLRPRLGALTRHLKIHGGHVDHHDHRSGHAVASTPSAACAWTRSRRRSPAIPGTPMGIAPVAYTLWQRFLRFDPADPIWPNRDRFVLSEGHASALLWSLLHLTGVRAVDPDYEVLGRPAVTLDDLKTFRQLDSRCPGHPEYRWTSGVETTTGPLGQGVATSVGMAIAGQWLAARYNRDGFPLFDFDVYAARRGRLHDGGHLLGGGLVRRSPAAVEPVLDLRLEPGDHRGPHRHHVHRGRGRAVPGLRLERDDRRRRQRPRRGAAGAAHVPGRRRAPDADRGAQPHRVRLAGRGHAEGARRAARRGGRHGRPSGSSVCPRTSTSTFRTGCTTGSPAVSVRAAARRATRGRSSSRRTAASIRELADEIERMQRRELPDGWDRRAADVPGRRRRGSPPATPPVRCSTRSRRRCPGCSAARPTSRRRPRRG